MSPTSPERPFTGEQLEAISRVLGDTNMGLTGSEIGHTLIKCSIPDVEPNATKWVRIHNALVAKQNDCKVGNHTLALIAKALDPVRHLSNRERFDWMRTEVNKALAFAGWHFREDGKFSRVDVVKTIQDAEARADDLRQILEQRNVHQHVLQFCRAELLQDNYFHAVLEATKSVASKLREKTDLKGDGSRLATTALSFDPSGIPMLAINSLTTDTEKSEQTGFMNLVVGLFGTFRNPTAHAEKIYWPIDKQDALDILSLVSLVHRKLDKSRRLK